MGVGVVSVCAEDVVVVVVVVVDGESHGLADVVVAAAVVVAVAELDVVRVVAVGDVHEDCAGVVLLHGPPPAGRDLYEH